ncbi:MAG TPA: family 20 glycosylhydrolase [Gemmatimonadaceae bacterium]|nr:family 20 glycosylhydrolase [Gemmatimonadaceae bacterium]
MRFLTLLLLCGIAAAPVAAQAPAPIPLIPLPRDVVRGARVPLPAGVGITHGGRSEDAFTAQDLAQSLGERRIRADTATSAGRYAIELLRLSTPRAHQLLRERKVAFDSAMTAEGYVLLADAAGAQVVAANARGLFYGAQTLKQLVNGTGASAVMQAAQIRDWPAMKYRGFHDDLSRGPVPTLEYQKAQIRRFAAYKLNVYSPYYEHSLAYSANPLIAPPRGAMTRTDVRELIAYAAKYHIEVIPEQEAFGHLHHVLKYELYSELAETPHGHVLAPGKPGSMTLIKSWFAEIDSLFPSKFVHIGADETVELGRGQTRDRVQAEGLGKVYLQFVRDIDVALKPNGKRLMFWADIAMNSPQLVGILPKDMVAVCWDYWSFNGFDRCLKPFKDAGMETWVAPGVNNWSRAYPYNAVALRNIQAFVRDGQAFGATGVLNTSWDDDGDALFEQLWYGVLFGAAAGWQPGESSIYEFERSFGRVFHGDTTGKIDAAQRKLIAAHQALVQTNQGDGRNELYWLDPWSTEGQVVSAKIRPGLKELRIQAESALVLIAQARAMQPDIREQAALEAMEVGARRLDFIGMKFQFAEEIAQMYARASTPINAHTSEDLNDIASPLNGRINDLKEGYVLGREVYEHAWGNENRPTYLGNLTNRYDAAAQLWIQRSEQIRGAIAQLRRTKTLPSMEQLGIPRPAPIP